jgi:hypothetical protein
MHRTTRDGQSSRVRPHRRLRARTHKPESASATLTRTVDVVMGVHGERQLLRVDSRRVKGRFEVASPDELREQTVEELREQARARGIAGASELRKEELVQALQRWRVGTGAAEFWSGAFWYDFWEATLENWQSEFLQFAT